MTNPIFPDIAPWPETAPLPPRDHNKPPVEETVAAEFREELLSERPDFLTFVENLIEAGYRAYVDSDETLGRAGEMIKRCRAAENYVDDVHKRVKEPHLKAGRVCDAEKNRLKSQIDEARTRVQKLMNAYTAKKDAEARAERERIAEEQRRAAAEAQAAGVEAAIAYAPAEVKRPEPVRSDAGATVSTKTVWNSSVDNYELAFAAVASDAKVREAIDSAVARLVRAGLKEIPGCKIWPTTQAVAR